jgi:hypothetical protein
MHLDIRSLLALGIVASLAACRGPAGDSPTVTVTAVAAGAVTTSYVCNGEDGASRARSGACPT